MTRKTKVSLALSHTIRSTAALVDRLPLRGLNGEVPPNWYMSHAIVVRAFTIIASVPSLAPEAQQINVCDTPCEHARYLFLLSTFNGSCGRAHNRTCFCIDR